MDSCIQICISVKHMPKCYCGLHLTVIKAEKIIKICTFEAEKNSFMNM